MKHWTEPNGIFIIRIPIEWQYTNAKIKDGKDEPPYCFEPYEEPIGSFQISCYPLNEKGTYPSLRLQNNNSEVEWTLSQLNDEKFRVHLYGARVDDQLCFAKYIYSKSDESNPTIKKELEKVNTILKKFVLIPQCDRKYASDLNKYDNFYGSLGASFDLIYKAIDSESFVELVVISSNQIDAFLRLSIILHNQISKESNEIESKYLFQGENEKGINERIIYTEAHSLGIIDDDLNKELNDLYNLRNRVIHRYIISYLKTRDIINISHDYLVLHEKVRLILRGLEQLQSKMGIGIYGQGLKSIDDINENDRRRVYAFANDKHLYDKLKRKL